MMLPDAQSPAGGPGQTRLPQRLSPMLATPGVLPGDGAGWALEMKWDGIRALAFVEDGRLRLASRTGRDITAAYPDLAGLGPAEYARGAVWVRPCLVAEVAFAWVTPGRRLRAASCQGLRDDKDPAEVVWEFP